ncbi:hypothetical protein Airi02_070430 [Actinoallomurus iriomotensis]|uniref:Uncharacterized protein n=1 Tax=Actinoallomurus iriomotensis TaxID=478107 RepID=A0A9W6S8Q2_9ACTN|nr:hypothetical protein Airi02_070430 [Actinoallomurus iriomotensis]
MLPLRLEYHWIAWAAVLFAATAWLCGAAWTTAGAVGAAEAGADIATVPPSAAASVIAASPVLVTRAFVILMLILPEAGDSRAVSGPSLQSAYKSDVAGS